MKSLLIAFVLLAGFNFAKADDSFRIKPDTYTGVVSEVLYRSETGKSDVLSQIQVSEIFENRKIETENGTKVLKLLLKVTQAQYNVASVKYQNVQFVTVTVDLNKAQYNTEYAMSSAPGEITVQFNGKENEEISFASQSSKCALDGVEIHCDAKTRENLDQTLVISLK